MTNTPAETVERLQWPPSEEQLNEWLAQIVEVFWSASSANFIRAGKLRVEDIKAKYALREIIRPFAALTAAAPSASVAGEAMREALRKCSDALTLHHQWHAAQTDPDEHGLTMADGYAESDMYDHTVNALSAANAELSDGPVNAAALQPKPDAPDRVTDGESRCSTCGESNAAFVCSNGFHAGFGYSTSARLLEENEALRAALDKYGQHKSGCNMARALPSKPDAVTVPEKLGRFGHHPDARTDYECEIDALIGMAYERLTMGGQPDLEERIWKAMDFRTTSTPGELRWLNQVFRGKREIYAVKPAWVHWPEDRLAAYTPKPDAPDRVTEGEPIDAVVAQMARTALGAYLAWPDAARDGPVEVGNGKTYSWLQGLPDRLATPARLLEENEALKRALANLGKACDELAATRSRETYLSMVDRDHATTQMLALDDARTDARAALGGETR